MTRHGFLLGIMIILCAAFVHADTYLSFSSTPECIALCNAGDYGAASNCFNQLVNDADAYLATAHCALNNNADDVAEKYAVRSAKDKIKWIRWLYVLPQAQGKLNTGGLSETFMAAWVASENDKYKEQAIKFARGSGMCKHNADEEEKQTCAERYFNFHTADLQKRNILGTRGQSDYKLSGHITGGDPKKPLKNVRVGAKCSGKIYKTTTDNNGYYEFPIDTSMKPCLTAGLYVKLEYFKDNKKYFRIMNRGKTVVVRKKFNIRSGADLTQNMDLSAPLIGAAYKGIPHSKFIHHFSANYVHMAEALEFFKDYLLADVDYKLPVDVVTFHAGTSTYYTPTTATIVISKDDSKVDASDRPKNREYHEFGHHVMYSEYGQWPFVPNRRGHPAETNHGGFINPSTADSYVEGFAEWAALAIAEHNNQTNPEIYAGFGSLEDNYIAYGWRGAAEEFAVAGALWDLQDGGDADDDEMNINIYAMWNELDTYRKDMQAVYQAFVGSFSDEQDAIDDIFYSHGLFHDKGPAGNGVWDNAEPYIDADNNNNYTAGEYFVDYSTNIRIDANEPAGKTTNPGRAWRTSAQGLPGSFVKVDNNVPHYSVKVEYPKHPYKNYEITADNEDGYVYVPIPPIDYEAKITLTPLGVTGAKPLTLLSHDAHEHMSQAFEHGHVHEHDFEVSSGSTEDISELVDDKKVKGDPYWDAYEEKASEEDYEYKEPRNSESMEKSINRVDGLTGLGAHGMLHLIPPAIGLLILLLIARKVYKWVRPKKKSSESHETHHKKKKKHKK